MEFTIKGKNIDVNEPVRAYVTRKMAKVSRYLDSAAIDGVVELTHEATRQTDTRYVAQVTVGANHSILRGEARAATWQAAVDEVAGVMQRQAVRYKERGYRRGKSQGARAIGAETIIDEPGESPANDGPSIVKTKHFAIKPMPPEEAAEEMEYLGHDFYVFLNDHSNRVSVVYRRRDGNYGLIEPEVS
jgi:putative sigma-54 modulation protein